MSNWQPFGLFGLMRRLWGHLNGSRRLQCAMLLGLMIISAFLEAVSLGLILPFLGVLTSPQQVMDKPFFNRYAELMGVVTAQDWMLVLTSLFIFATLASAAVRLILLWTNTQFSFSVGADLGLEVYRRTLYQPYSVHLTRNSSELISGITGKVAGIVYGALLPLLALLSASVMLFAVMAALIAIDAAVATSALVGFGIIYLLTVLITKYRLKRNSQLIANAQPQVIKALQEGLGGIRDVLLDGSQPLYCDIYRRADKSLRTAQGSNMFISLSPRYITEALGMTLIAVLAYVMSRQGGGGAQALPVLGALAMGAQRLLPALQQIYSSWVGILGSQDSLSDALDLLDQPLPSECLEPVPEKLPLQRQIEFVEVKFKYNPQDNWVLDGINFTIPKGARVGFVGVTGSGKSTTLDLLMGLLEPVEGRVLVDGEPIRGIHRRAWQQSIAHVPQTVYLTDASLTENIAFGVHPDSIDMEQVRQSASQAQLEEFINGLPNGYGTFVGERGVRLSGGQRQRIGIARALYKRANVLVFDEATSALDNSTERAVMDAIDNLDRNLTILIVAHRLTTVKHCDTIIQLESGRVVAQGTYDYLCANSPSFRKMAA